MGSLPLAYNKYGPGGETATPSASAHGLAWEWLSIFRDCEGWQTVCGGPRSSATYPRQKLVLNAGRIRQEAAELSPSPHRSSIHDRCTCWRHRKPGTAPARRHGAAATVTSSTAAPPVQPHPPGCTICSDAAFSHCPAPPR